jgi:hypothetical protein
LLTLKYKLIIELSYPLQFLSILIVKPIGIPDHTSKAKTGLTIKINDLDRVVKIKLKAKST